MTNSAPNQNSQQNNSGSGSKKKPYRRKFRPKNNANKAADANRPETNNGQKQTNGAPKKYSNKKRNFSKNRGPKVSGVDYISTKYLNLLDQHIQARKKYFENFDRVNLQTRLKLEKNFVDSQQAFLEFKERLKPEDLELYQSRYEALKPDLTYSKNHGIEINPERPIFAKEEEIENPHLLISQVEHEFKGDSEESVGSIDDYKKYKGISE